MMIDKSRFRTILQRILEKSKADKVHWLTVTEEDVGERYNVLFSDGAQLTLYYDSPPEAPDSANATLFVSECPVISITAKDGGDDWGLLMSIVTEARRCVFHFDEVLNKIEKALDSDKIGLSREEAGGSVEHFLAFVAGKWSLTWSGPQNGQEVAEIDKSGGYFVGNSYCELQMLEFVPGERVKFLKRFNNKQRPAPETNDLLISDAGRIMSGTGFPPPGLMLRYERLS